MRIYGSSPLYNYVELLFRCKRMFIVAIILGTIVTGWAASLRRTQYSAKMVIALTGDPSAGTTTNQSGQPTLAPGVARKATRLLKYWLPDDNSFLTDVVTNSNLDKRYPKKTVAKLIREVRDAITCDGDLRGGQFLVLQMTWSDPKEAELVLNQVYSVFSSRTVETETAEGTIKETNLKRQFETYDVEANKRARERQKWLEANYWYQPTKRDTYENQKNVYDDRLRDLELGREDYRTRLAQVQTRLKSTPARIVSSEKKRVTQDRPDLALMDQKKELEGQLVQLKSRYSDLHPQVVELKKKIAALDQQIADARKAPAVERDEGTERTTELNPEYVELRRMQAACTMGLTSVDRQIAKLRRLMGESDDRLKQMPDKDVEFAEITSDFQLYDAMRSQIRNQYYTVKVENEREKDTQARLVRLELPPVSEPLDQSAKSALLYLAGPILGIILAFCFSLLAELMDHSLRTPIDVERHLGKPVLAVIPRVSATQETRKQLGGQASPSITS